MLDEQAQAFRIFQNTAEAFYHKTRTAWFVGRSDLQPAQLRFALVDATAAIGCDPYFSLSLNEIYLPVADGDLEDYANSGYREADIFGRWTKWKMELVHEMLHEWQQRKPCVATPAATLLNQSHRRHFQGQGHGDDFYQAIIEQAPYFQMTPDQLLAAI